MRCPCLVEIIINAEAGPSYTLALGISPQLWGENSIKSSILSPKSPPLGKDCDELNMNWAPQCFPVLAPLLLFKVGNRDADSLWNWRCWWWWQWGCWCWWLWLSVNIIIFTVVTLGDSRPTHLNDLVLEPLPTGAWNREIQTLPR